MFKYPTHPQSLGQLIVNSFRLYARTLQQLWMYSLLIAFCLVVFPELITAVSLLLLNALIPLWLGFVPLYILLFALLSFVYVLSFMRIEYCVTQNKRCLRSELHYAFKKWPSCLGVLFITVLFIFCTQYSVGIISNALIIAIKTFFPGYVVIGGVSVMLFFKLLNTILFIVILTVFSTIIPNILFHQKKIFAAYKESGELVGSVWRPAMVCFIVIVVALTIPNALSLVVLFIGHSMSVSVGIQFVLMMVMVSLLFSANLVVFHDLILRHQSLRFNVSPRICSQ